MDSENHWLMLQTNKTYQSFYKFALSQVQDMASSYHEGRLSKHIRLKVYSFMQTSELIFKISKLSKRERSNISASQIACEEREGTLILPRQC